MRRIGCIVIGKISLVVVSTMSVATHSDKFKYIGESPDCTKNADF